MLTNKRRFVSRASSSVSGVHSCHAVGLSICERTYGLLLSPHLFVRDTTRSFELAIVAKATLPNMGARGAWDGLICSLECNVFVGDSCRTLDDLSNGAAKAVVRRINTRRIREMIADVVLSLRLGALRYLQISF